MLGERQLLERIESLPVKLDRREGVLTKLHEETGILAVKLLLDKGNESSSRCTRHERVADRGERRLLH